MNENSTPKITIDTNCIIGLFDSKSETATSLEELRDLIRYAMTGKVQIFITTRVEVDVGRDKNDERRAAMMHGISMLPVIGTVARWSQSKWGGGDVWVGPDQRALVGEVQKIVFPGLTPDSGKFPNKLADIDHLVGHKLAQHDIFVTDDKGILRRHVALRDGLGILVMNPAECLRFVDAHKATIAPNQQQTGTSPSKMD